MGEKGECSDVESTKATQFCLDESEIILP